jgi:hypothetical protein
MAGTLFVFLSLQGCMASTTTLPAEEAFALSASKLSGTDRYGIEGEVSIQSPSGWVSSKAAYKGEVTLHGNLKMEWTTSNIHSASVKPQGITAFQPLQLLEAINKQTAVISYAETPLPAQPVHFRIKLNDEIARERVAKGLRADFVLLRTESSLLRRDPVKAEKILSTAGKQLEAAIATLKVTTVCDWTANPKDWFPSQLKEETVLNYKLKDKPYQEMRVSETYFHLQAQDGTINKNKGQ